MKKNSIYFFLIILTFSPSILLSQDGDESDGMCDTVYQACIDGNPYNPLLTPSEWAAYRLGCASSYDNCVEENSDDEEEDDEPCEAGDGGDGDGNDCGEDDEET